MTSSRLRQVLLRMQTAFFCVSDDGALVYEDPFIGRLHHRTSDLLVRVNRGLLRLELVRGSHVLEMFEMELDPAEACRRACAAYFKNLESWARQSPQERAAA